jgi:hypothetical protein
MQARGATLSWFGSVDASNITSGVGTINMRTEALNYRSELKEGISPLVRISITGSFKDLGAMPNFNRLTLRGGASSAISAAGGSADDPVRRRRPPRCEALAHRGN